MAGAGNVGFMRIQGLITNDDSLHNMIPTLQL